ncbi:hypothetical protein FGB62_201g07 [Gracilaria domingensis]|nr:hypothetical protein FGB62_201g07 [Gracilaria domingensis]
MPDSHWATRSSHSNGTLHHVACALNSLCPEKRKQAIDAVRGRYDREQFYGDGAHLRAGMPTAQGVPTTSALVPSSVLNADPNGSPSNPAINGVIGRTPATSGLQIDSSILNTQTLMNTAATLCSIQPDLSLGATRTSAAESQTRRLTTDSCVASFRSALYGHWSHPKS